MRLHQILVSASTGDAITNHAMQLQPILQEFGESLIFARHVDPRLGDKVLPLDLFRHKSPEPNNRHDWLFYHASIGEPDVMAFLEQRNERLMLIYHNITPAHYFEEYDPAFARLLTRGKMDLSRLREETQFAIAVSDFNAQELEEIGYENVLVAPLIVDCASLLEREPDSSTMNHLETKVQGPIVLFVGQLLPHKRPDLLIQTLHVLATYLEPKSLLIMAGWARQPKYKSGLQAFLNELNLTNAWLAESVSDSKLVAFYRNADVFATMSEHEGFCAPLLEAMAFDVPIIARAFAAIPETLGDAGILIPPDEGPIVGAEAMATLASDKALQTDLTERGHRRLKEYSADRSRSIFRSHLTEIL